MKHYSYCNFTTFVYRESDELLKQANVRGTLNHVNVVTLHAMIFERQHYGVVLEFVPGGCLEDYMYKNKVLFNTIKYTFFSCV